MDTQGTQLGIDYFDLVKWLIGAICFLAWGYVNRLAGRVDKVEDKHAKLDKRVTRVETHLELPPIEGD